MTTPPDAALPSGTQWHLSAAGYEATVVEVGGALRTLRHEGADLVHGYDAHEMADAARGHVLAPWPNRIDGGRYTFADVDHVLALTEPGLLNASHGLVQWAPWRLVTHTASALTLGCVLRPQPGWAWTLDLTLAYTLDERGLTVTPSATNLSDAPCPFGFGMHPYLTAGERTLDDATLTLPAHTQIDVDDRLIPTSRRACPPALRTGTSLRGVTLDMCFTDLDLDDPSRWSVTLATTTRSTTLWADDAYRFVQTFTGDGLPEPKNRRSGLAVEPMTCAANAFNSGDRLIVLEPGETWSAPFGIHAGPRQATA